MSEGRVRSAVVVVCLVLAQLWVVPIGVAAADEPFFVTDLVLPEGKTDQPYQAGFWGRGRQIDAPFTVQATGLPPGVGYYIDNLIVSDEDTPDPDDFLYTGYFVVTISGAPTTVGEYPVAVVVRDTWGTSVTRSDVLTVRQAQFCEGLLVTVEGSGTITGTTDGDVILGSDGPDVINARAGYDTICGGGGDDVIRDAGGADRVFGGPGNDHFVAYFLRDGGDDFDGGSGLDHLDYSERPTGPVKVTFDGLDGFWGNDGEAEEGDAVVDGIEIVTGTSGNDVLIGNAGGNRLYGGPGDDRLHGLGGGDRVDGGSGDDRLTGAGGADHLLGGAGLDDCASGRGNDRVNLDDAAGGDYCDLGPGNDLAILNVGDTVDGAERTQTR